MPGLTIGRTVGQSIFIGDNVTITVLRIKGLKTRIQIDAPRDIPVIRSELCQKKKNPRPNRTRRRLHP